MALAPWRASLPSDFDPPAATRWYRLALVAVGAAPTRATRSTHIRNGRPLIPTCRRLRHHPFEATTAGGGPSWCSSIEPATTIHADVALKTVKGRIS